MNAAAATTFRRALTVVKVLLFSAVFGSVFSSVASACPACAAADAGHSPTRSVLAVLSMLLAPPLVVLGSAFALWRVARGRR